MKRIWKIILMEKITSIQLPKDSEPMCVLPILTAKTGSVEAPIQFPTIFLQVPAKHEPIAEWEECKFVLVEEGELIAPDCFYLGSCINERGYVYHVYIINRKVEEVAFNTTPNQ